MRNQLTFTPGAIMALSSVAVPVFLNTTKTAA
jgi:hypothetical protein